MSLIEESCLKTLESRDDHDILQILQLSARVFRNFSKNSPVVATQLIDWNSSIQLTIKSFFITLERYFGCSLSCFASKVTQREKSEHGVLPDYAITVHQILLAISSLLSNCVTVYQVESSPGVH
jgi:hypothetical protein